MTSSDYIRAYSMRKVGHGVEAYYVRDIEKDGNLVRLSIHKLELADECYLVKQTFHRQQVDPITGLLGKWGKAHMVFGIKNTTFRAFEQEGDDEHGENRVC